MGSREKRKNRRQWSGGRITMISYFGNYWVIQRMDVWLRNAEKLRVHLMRGLIMSELRFHWNKDIIMHKERTRKGFRKRRLCQKRCQREKEKENDQMLAWIIQIIFLALILTTQMLTAVIMKEVGKRNSNITM